MQYALPLPNGSIGEDPLTLDLPGARAWLLRNFLEPREADALRQALIATIPWRQDVLRFGGRQVPVPRLQAWCGDPEARYAYSGLRLDPLPWPELLLPLKRRLQAYSGQPFNSVLLNYYRDGNDSVAWHSDNERELGPDPWIASLSLGATRRFELRHRRDKSLRRRCELCHGSLLLMAGGVQGEWLHRVPKQPAIGDARLNLTFRRIFPQDPGQKAAR